MTIEELFADEITDEIRAIARDRVLNGGNLASQKDRYFHVPKPQKQLALLLIKDCIPDFELFDGEEAIRIGVSEDKMTKIKRRRTPSGY